MDRAEKITVAMLVLIGLVATVAYAYTVWHLTTKITVLEPFQIKTNLPETLEAYPNTTYAYTINVTNTGGQDLNATLIYNVTAPANLTCNVTPPSGTTQKVPAQETVTFNITITPVITGELKLPANITIDWTIKRLP